jgi:BlaI family penicillinase repressor
MQLSDGEWKIMNALWRRGSATARELLDDLRGETAWAYTTAKTMLSRMAEKGAVRERKQGNVSVYEPALSQRQARRFALHGLIDRAFDGAFGPLMQHLVAEERLGAKDRAALRRMLREPRRGRQR